MVQILTTIAGSSYAVDDVIWPKGVVNQPWSYIFTGLVCGCIPIDNNAYQAVCIYGPGAWIGENAILKKDPSELEYVCLTDVRAMHVPFEIALETFTQEADYARYIGHLAASRSQLKGELLNLMRVGSPAQRVVCSLALHAESLLRNAPPTTRHFSETHLDLPLKQALLASMCGVSRSVFSLYIKQLAEAGWCTLHYANVSLLRPKTWGHFAMARRSNRLSTQEGSMAEMLQALYAASQAVGDIVDPVARSA